jgi:hypothetical protein
MSVQRRVNLLSEQRVDVPDLRSIESAASADFDTLIQSFVTGPTQGYVLRGFNIVMASAIGGAASSLQVEVDPGAIFHVSSSQSGTFYLVPTGTPVQTLNSATNTIVNGAFTPNAINYVSLEYQRLADDTTDAQTYFWDPTQNTETTKITPRALVLSYTLNITTTVPTSQYLPLAVVVTDASNNVTEITDARWNMFSLGAGGYSPNPFYQYTWPEGRTQNPVSSTSNSSDPFSGGDKAIGTLKDWMNAIMSSIQEIKGTTYWFSTSSSGSTQSLREDLGNTVITGKGSIAHGVLPSDGETPTAIGQVNWDQDIYIRVIGSEISYKLLANPTSTDITLADNEVAYLNLVRNQAITPSLIWTNGSPTVTSVGSVAWTAPLQSGDWIKLSSDTSAGFYQISTVDSLTQVTLTSNFAETSTGVAGLQSQYSYGSYQAAASPSTNRDIQIADRGSVPQGENYFWFLLRSDNTGAARVYVRFLSSELTQGESEDIGGEVPDELLKYVGSPTLSAYAPGYVSALNPGSVPLIQTLTFGAASTLTSGQYFEINSSANTRLYYVWANIGGANNDPMAPGRVGIPVDLTTGMTAAQVATAYASALGGLTPNDFTTSVSGAVVTVKNNSAGATVAAANFNMPSPFAIVETQAGTGVGNSFINDGDSLTLAIKKLDGALYNIVEGLDEPNYDEPMSVVASSGGSTPAVLYSYTTPTGGENFSTEYSSGATSVAYRVEIASPTTITQFNALLYNQSGTGSFYAQIYTDRNGNGGCPTNTVGTASNTVAATSLPNGPYTSGDTLSGKGTSFNFSTPVVLQPGAYWFVIVGTDWKWSVAEGTGTSNGLYQWDALNGSSGWLSYQSFTKRGIYSVTGYLTGVDVSQVFEPDISGFDGDNHYNAFRFTLANSTILDKSTMLIYNELGTSSGTMNCSIYTDTGSGPGTLISGTTTLSLNASQLLPYPNMAGDGLQTNGQQFTWASSPTLPAGTYWWVLNTSNISGGPALYATCANTPNPGTWYYRSTNGTSWTQEPTNPQHYPVWSLIGNDGTSGASVPANEIVGPVVSGTVITLPPNTRISDVQEYYTVGAGALLLYLNGQYLRLGIDWAEVGTAETASDQIQILRNLVVGDVLEFRVNAGGGGSAGGGGGGEVGPQGPPGQAGPPGTNALYAMTISTKSLNYNVVSADNVLLFNCSSGNLVATLPSASTCAGRVFVFKKTDSTTNTLTINTTGGQLCDGAVTQVITVQYESLTMVCDGTSFYLI